jgi:ABC-type microcin C transport system duplicated ATPase subunit YejF
MTSLNPVYTVGFQLAEPLRAHMGMSKAQARARSIELLNWSASRTPSGGSRTIRTSFRAACGSG